eukprot:CAMPEP_0172508710 /NCGR_PEP_ID=MMETSP1066-20121228/214195_1 /TAXON_ID=671091 /ORGANISM="Coscinodiscus wailesii, Strain CCMP2513" /LENGTH=188 /DNA_ID=CAMNT_0013286829 /DNA_START=174 /DNA_END=736 /DNA_ORIENTATION=+
MTLPKSWKNGPVSRLLAQFVESYNSSKTISNELAASDLHIATRRENTPSYNNNNTTPQTTTTTTTTTTIPLPCDGNVIDVINDRADLYILHGPFKTRAQLAEDARKIADEQKSSAAELASCTHFGCRKKFPRGGPYPTCQYHVSPPVFHETAKFWSCCPNKKAYDWDDFQAIEGCRMGNCSEVKEDMG